MGEFDRADKITIFSFFLIWLSFLGLPLFLLSPKIISLNPIGYFCIGFVISVIGILSGFAAAKDHVKKLRTIGKIAFVFGISIGVCLMGIYVLLILIFIFGRYFQDILV